MPDISEKWFRVIGVTSITLSSVYSNKLYNQPLSAALIIHLLVILISVILTWEGNRFIILFFRKKFPGQQNAIKRSLVIFLTGMPYTWIILISSAIERYIFLYGSAIAWEEIKSGRLFLNVFNNSLSKSFLQFSLLYVVYEIYYYHKRLQQTEEQNKQLEKEKLWSQLEKLNQQVNPHFLFNTLNSLSSLITEDPAEADRFLNEMSKVYRYLLDNNKHELVTLQTELKFIHSFYQLLKLRYNEGVELVVQNNSSYDDYLLPPLTLQLLVENAVKHNITSVKQPLQINIYITDNARLIIKNNLQKKTVKPVSHKIGLSNISDKYRLMQQEEVIINEEQGCFIVSLPLINPAVNRKLFSFSTAG